MMHLLFHYRKATPTCRGYVADFCPIERMVTAQRIDTIHEAHYLTFVRIAEGEVLRLERTCLSCGVTLAESAPEYAELAPSPGVDLATLEAGTNPGVSERNRELIRLREEIEGGAAVAPALKEALLKEQFAILEQIAEQQWRGQTKADRTSVGWAAASIAGWFAAVMATRHVTGESRWMDAIGWLMGGALLLIVVNAVIFFRAPARELRRKVLPLIAAALRPLRPTREEIEQLFRHLREEGFNYATKVKAGEVMALVAKARPVG